jgi:two-component system, LuxR family, response regulator FixJ
MGQWRVKLVYRTNGTMHIQRVGLIEDDPILQEVLEYMTRYCGYEVACFLSAEAFLTDGKDGEYGCLVIDLGLPGMTGAQLEANLRGQGVTTPIVLISGFDPESIAALGTSTAVTLLRKPFGFIELQSALKQAFGPVVGE